MEESEEPIQTSSEEDDNESNESEAAETTDDGLPGIEGESFGSTSPESDQDIKDDEYLGFSSNHSTESLVHAPSRMKMGNKMKDADNIGPVPSRYDSESSATDTEESPLPKQKRENEATALLDGLRREVPEPKRYSTNLPIRSSPVNEGRIRARSIGP